MIVLDYESASRDVKWRLLRFINLPATERNKLNQVVAWAKRRSANRPSVFDECIYERRNYAKSKSAYYFDRKKHQENIYKRQSENFKRDEILGEILELVADIKGAKWGTAKALANAGLAKNAKSAVQIFCQGGTLKQLEFMREYVENKYKKELK